MVRESLHQCSRLVHCGFTGQADETIPDKNVKDSFVLVGECVDFGAAARLL